jgi:hypothetical protein
MQLSTDHSMTPAERVDRIMAEAVGSDLSSWEKFNFLPDIKLLIVLTLKQDEVLRRIEKRIFGRAKE